MGTFTEGKESDIDSPESTTSGDVIARASEIANQDMGNVGQTDPEGPPPPPPSQAELRNKWGHLPEDTKMSPGGLPMSSELPPTPQSIIDRNDRSESVPAKKSFFDRFRRENSSEPSSPLPRPAEPEGPPLPPSWRGEKPPVAERSPDGSREAFDANSDSAEDVRNAALSRIDQAIQDLKTDQELTESQKFQRSKDLEDLRKFVPSYFGVNNTASGYVEAVRRTETDAANKLDQVNKQRFNWDNEKIDAEAAAQKDIRLAKMLGSPQFLPRVTKPAA